MESVILRKLCHFHVRQLKSSCQSWRSLTALSKLLASSKFTYSRSYCTKSGDKHPGDGQANKQSPDNGEVEEKPFISPVRKPQDMDSMQKLKEIRMKKAEAKARKGPNLVLIAAAAVGFVALYLYLKDRLRKYEIAAVKQTMGSTQDEVLVGGDWELTNQDGKRMTNKEFMGQWCLIYFGFTHCPDICPDEIEKITEVMDILDRNSRLPKVRALFVTVDPDRDSPEALKNYLAEFSDKIVGLTGNWDELKKILKAFKVYFSRGPVDEDGDYIVDHSIITYLMNPDGKYEAHFARSKTNVEVANTVEGKMNTWTSKSR